MASRRNNGPPSFNENSPAQYEMATSPTLRGTPSTSCLRVSPPSAMSQSSSEQSSSSGLSFELPQEKLDGNLRRQRLNESSDVSADDSDMPSWKGKQKDESSSLNLNGTGAKWTSGSEFLTPISTAIVDHWEAAHTIAVKYDRGVLENWKDELEKCLIIVGLCSAPAAGFVIQYLSSGGQAAMSTVPGDQAAMSPENAQNSSLGAPSLHISIFWVLSLVVTLGTVVVGITCLQWIREYLSDPRLSPKEGLAFRQMRYDGLMFWKVPFIISILPSLLLLSILIFFHGLLLFLYSLDHIAAYVIAVPIGMVWVFMLFATVLPALQCIFMSEERAREHQCPYKSPQARIFAWFAFWFAVIFIRVLRRLGWRAEFLIKKQTFLENLIKGGLDWVSFDTTWKHERSMEAPDKSQEREGHDIAQALVWLSKRGSHSVEGIHALYSSLRDVHPATALETIRKLVPRDYISEFTVQCGHDHRHDEVLKDLMGAVLLGYCVRNNLQLQAPLFQHRMELFIRIANSLVGILGEDTRPLVEKYFTGAVTIISPFSENQDYAEVPDHYKHQLLMTFNAHLKARSAALQPLSSALWNIVCPMVAQIIKGYPSGASNQNLQIELSIINKELKAYFRHISSNPDQEERWKLVRLASANLNQYMNHFFTQGTDAQSSIEHPFPDFWEGLTSLQSVVTSPTSPPHSSRFSTASQADTIVA